MAINEALNDLHEDREDNFDLIPQSPLKSIPVAVIDEPVSPIKEKQRRSSFDVTHTKSPILAPEICEIPIEPFLLTSAERSTSLKHPTGKIGSNSLIV